MNPDTLSRAGLEQLLTLWRSRPPREWADDPEPYVALARRLLALGEPLLAYDVADAGLTRWPDQPPLVAVLALALARSGDTRRANELLGGLLDAGIDDEEISGIHARTLKDLWLSATGPQAQVWLGRARQCYEVAYRRFGGYWHGINAATLCLVEGRRDQARDYAQALRERLAAQDGADYWSLATLGEAALILGDTAAAAQWYRRAARDAAPGDLASTRRNARLLVAHGCASSEWLDAALPRPRLAVFRGREGEPAPELAARLRQALAADQIRIGFAGGGTGADILFSEALLESGGELNLVLPFPPEQFIPQCLGATPAWIPRLERLLARAASVTCASSHPAGAVSFAYADLLMLGLARSRARHVDGELQALAEDGARAVPAWRACGQDVRLLGGEGVAGGAPADYWRVAAGGGDSRLVSLLFADVVGYSKFSEAEILRFGRDFLGVVAQALEALSPPPLFRNTWGDGLYFVFDSPAQAGVYALDLQERVAAVDWAAHGLPPNLSLRIGLHGGPAYALHDPVMGRVTYTGAHVSRAARIEPITPPGQVYASEAFAALCEADGVASFHCAYVGRTPLAKGFGTFPTYRLQRRLT